MSEPRSDTESPSTQSPGWQLPNGVAHLQARVSALTAENARLRQLLPKLSDDAYFTDPRVDEIAAEGERRLVALRAAEAELGVERARRETAEALLQSVEVELQAQAVEALRLWDEGLPPQVGAMSRVIEAISAVLGVSSPIKFGRTATYKATVTTQEDDDG